MTGHRGSAALELVLLTPVLLAMIDLAVLGGRLTDAQSQVDGAANAASRAASIDRSPGPAISAASTTAMTTLAQQHVTCLSPAVQVDTSAFHPGGWVAVTVSCSTSLNDLGWLPVPATKTLTSRSVSAIDVYEAAS